MSSLGLDKGLAENCRELQNQPSRRCWPTLELRKAMSVLPTKFIVDLEEGLRPWEVGGRAQRKVREHQWRGGELGVNSPCSAGIMLKMHVGC